MNDEDEINKVCNDILNKYQINNNNKQKKENGIEQKTSPPCVDVRGIFANYNANYTRGV